MYAIDRLGVKCDKSGHASRPIVGCPTELTLTAKRPLSMSAVKTERSLSDAGSSQATTNDDGVDEIQGKIIQLCAEYPKGMFIGRAGYNDHACVDY